MTPYDGIVLGERIWKKSFDSPVVAIYSVEKAGTIGSHLRKVPMVSVGKETMAAITGSSALALKMDTDVMEPVDALLK